MSHKFYIITLVAKITLKTIREEFQQNVIGAQHTSTATSVIFIYIKCHTKISGIGTWLIKRWYICALVM